MSSLWKKAKELTPQFFKHLFLLLRVLKKPILCGGSRLLDILVRHQTSLFLSFPSLFLSGNAHPKPPKGKKTTTPTTIFQGRFLLNFRGCIFSVINPGFLDSTKPLLKPMFFLMNLGLPGPFWRSGYLL